MPSSLRVPCLSCVGMHDTCPTPAFTSKSRDSVVSLDCGSPWAVDLTADADCNREGVERCHPRLTLGWRRQEVLLSMPSDPLPTAEYVQAYCDLWRRGRHENVLVAPVEQDEARSRAHRDRRRLFSTRSAASGGLDVLVLVLRGLSLEHSRRALTRTLGHLRQLNASGQYTLATAERFRALSSEGAASLRVLLQGAAVADDEHGAPWPTLWDTYRQWGYVSMFGEAGCGTATRAKVPPWQQRPGSAPAPPQGAPGGSGQLGTPRLRLAHRAPSRCLGCACRPPPKPPMAPP